MSFIALGTPGDIRMATKCWMFPLPTVLALQDTWVHISTFDGSDETSNVEATIDDVLRWRTTLGILDVYLDHCHVWFWRCFDDMRFWGQHDIFKNVGFFKNTLDIVRRDNVLFNFVWKSNDFYIWFGLWEIQTLDWVWIDIWILLRYFSIVDKLRLFAGLLVVITIPLFVI